MVEGLSRMATGQTSQAEGHLDEAIASYQEAVRLDPHASTAYHNEAILLYGLGRYEEALHAFGEVLRLDSQCRWALDAQRWIRDRSARTE